jgi:hypothetical protein
MAKSPNRLKASIVDLTFMIWAAVVPLALSQRLFSGDGDFARHLRMGNFILEGGPWQVDSLAHTFTGPFLTTEWLSQITFALAHRAGGLPVVGVLVGLVVGLAYALITLFMLRRGIDPFLAYATAIVAAVLGAPHWVARPHLATFVGLGVLIHLVAGRTRPRLWWFAPFFVLWVNFHGGFVLGLMILGALLAGDLAEAWLDPEQRPKWLADARFHGSALAIGAAATVVNPMGLKLPLRVLNILGNSYLLSNTSEFESPDFHLLWGRLLLFVIIGIVIAYALRRERPSFPLFAVVLMLLAGSLFARRNAPLFGLFALPFVAIEIDALCRSVAVRWFVRLRTVFDEGERIAVRGRWAPWWAALLVAFALTGGSVAGTQLIRNEFDKATFPVAAVAAAREAGLAGNMFNYFTWGGYILWAWPEQRIYIDGMTDFLGNEVLQSYSKVYWLEPDWEDELRDHDVSFAIFPTGSRVTYALRETSGWHTWYEDDVATILTRDARTPAVQ